MSNSSNTSAQDTAPSRSSDACNVCGSIGPDGFLNVCQLVDEDEFRIEVSYASLPICSASCRLISIPLQYEDWRDVNLLPEHILMTVGAERVEVPMEHAFDVLQNCVIREWLECL